MAGGRSILGAFGGRCLCGAVRYQVAEGPAEMVLCHCDMCRRGTGAAIAGFVSVAATAVTWRGQPDMSRSSDIAERGFCGRCGTSLFYRSDGSETIALSAGSALDLDFAPVLAFYAEQAPAWLRSAHSLRGDAATPPAAQSCEDTR